ncbi:MAG TPA: hypothetical protein VIK34_07755 [Clostridiaceae bacterium]
MKTNKSVDVITMFSTDAPMVPLHFKISLDDDFFDPIMENKVLTVTKESSVGSGGILYKCHYEHDNSISFCNLKFEPSLHKWKLFM